MIIPILWWIFFSFLLDLNVMLLSPCSLFWIHIILRKHFTIVLTNWVFLQLRLNSDGYIIGTEYLSDLVEKEHTAHKHGEVLSPLNSIECLGHLDPCGLNLHQVTKMTSIDPANMRRGIYEVIPLNCWALVSFKIIILLFLVIPFSFGKGGWGLG